MPFGRWGSSLILNKGKFIMKNKSPAANSPVEITE